VQKTPDAGKGKVPSPAWLEEAIALGRATEGNPRFRDTRAILRLARSTPDVIHGISISPLQSILRVAVVGRPFIVGTEQRHAAIEVSNSWQIELMPDFRKLDSSQRRRVGDHWAAVGREEHASIASFSRFILQLLALGAPSELIEAATRAL